MKSYKKVFHEIYPIDITGLSKPQIANAIKEYKKYLIVKNKVLDKLIK